MTKRLILVIGFIVFLNLMASAENKIYWGETGDTIYVPNFPAQVDLHLKFDNDDTLVAMLHAFSWEGSVGVDYVIEKSCDNEGWFAGSVTVGLDVFQVCEEEPYKKVLAWMSMDENSRIFPGQKRDFATWSFSIKTENASLCLDSTFVPPCRRLKWTNNAGEIIRPEYTKKCWVIAKSPGKLNQGTSPLEERRKK
jgi:hypothetical protein